MGTFSLRTVFRAIAAAATATIAVMFVYAAVQQTYRSGANDPQVQLAGDAAAALSAGAPVPAVVASDPVDMGSSLAPFLIVYDSTDRAIAGSGRLNGALPAPPSGVLALARKGGWHSVTWQPSRNVRIAAVLRRADDASGRVVLAGRSMREVEERESRLLLMSVLVWGALLVTSILAAVP